jgi:uncharacterized protein YbjT (DUF2867 family)
MGLRTKHSVAVAGASGFVGRALVDSLSHHHQVLALGRSVPSQTPTEHVSFRRCDLYNAEDAVRALSGATTSVYLVHSMLPSARLVQASFSDLDLICADNFARAAKAAGVSHIVYLGGLTPEDRAELSPHLKSREEVERVLGSHGANVTTLRAGMVIGATGSSFRILLRLAERLPWMIVPKWGSSRSQPVGLADVVKLLTFAVEHPEFAGHSYDVGAPSVLTYSDMLRRTGTLLGRATRTTDLPFNLPLISLLWVSTITGAPLDLVIPLVASMKHEMVATRGLQLQQSAGFALTEFDELMRTAIAEEAAARISSQRTATPESDGPMSLRVLPDSSSSQSLSLAPLAPLAARARTPNRAVSLQRFRKPASLSARQIADTYFEWLPKAMRPFIRVTPLAVPGCAFWLTGIAQPLLELTLKEAVSDDDRAVYEISGGLLLSPNGRGKGSLEFRSVLGGTFIMTLVSNFEPRLPWLIYKYTQAIAHALVMHAFGRHLAKIA